LRDVLTAHAVDRSGAAHHGALVIKGIGVAKIKDQTSVLGGTAKTEPTFHRYGSSLYLKQIWVKGSTDGCLIPSGPAEKNDRKSGKPAKETPEQPSERQL